MADCAIVPSVNMDLMKVIADVSSADVGQATSLFAEMVSIDPKQGLSAEDSGAEAEINIMALVGKVVEAESQPLLKLVAH
jgi:hypothetical protein